MKPNWKTTDGRVQLYLADCMDVLPTLVAEDMAVVTDPPYGMNYDTDNSRFTCGGRSDRTIVGDDKAFNPIPFLKFPNVILWGANHYAKHLPVGTTLVWLKRHPENYGYFLSDAEIGWQKGGCGVYVFNAPDSAGRRQKEFTGSPFGGSTSHPFQKPIDLMEWCVGRAEGAILDPFMGSATTGLACIRTGRRFIGIEKEQRYFDIAVKRIEEELSRFPLFEPKPEIEREPLLIK